MRNRGGRWIGVGVGSMIALGGAACGGPFAPSSGGRIDVLAYVIGDAAVWPRVGSHSQNQVIDTSRQEVCWVKYANPRTFECWRWDDSFLYHIVDHGIDGNTGESYTILDGRWMPRYFDGDWSLDVSTRIVWFDPNCRVEPGRSGPFRYHQRIWREPMRDAGGDLGTRDTLVLEYAPEDPAGGPSVPEHFYFGRGVGWYEWTRASSRSVFNQLGGPARSAARDNVCAVP